MVTTFYFIVFILTPCIVKAWVTLRKKEGNGDEDEETFIDPKTGTFWVEKQSDIKDYKQRPKEMDPLVLLQKAAHYRYFDLKSELIIK